MLLFCMFLLGNVSLIEMLEGVAVPRPSITLGTFDDATYKLVSYVSRT
jgi:hypothetical protein